MSTRARDELETELDYVDAALDEHLTFPARWYSDPAIYSFEMETVFSRSWHLAADLDQVAEPGSVFVTSAGQVPIVLTRDLAGVLHGFVNVCRHRAYPVASENGCRKTLQCQYHAWTYELDGSLRNAPGVSPDDRLDYADFSLIPVAVDTWDRFVFVNPNTNAGTFSETYPEFVDLAAARGLSFKDYVFHGDYEYEIAANWKVWAENATECYHCPTVHKNSFADAFDSSQERYEYVNQGSLMAQFTEFNKLSRNFPRDKSNARDDFKFIFMWPSTFFALDDLVAFPGVITPTGPETCHFKAPMYVHRDADPGDVANWCEMWNQTLLEDAEVVRLQQPGLRSRAVPHGRLMPSRESSILHFHRLVAAAMRDGLNV